VYRGYPEILNDVVSKEVEEGGEARVVGAFCLLFCAFGHAVEE
jgi:hypothetical protein